MTQNDVNALIRGQLEMSKAIETLGKRLGFLERTVYTFAGGIAVVAFLISTGYLKIGSN